MNSQASFVFDGEHHKEAVVAMLRQRLKGLRHLIESSGRFAFRIYVASDETKDETLRVCKLLNRRAIFDTTKELDPVPSP